MLKDSVMNASRKLQDFELLEKLSGMLGQNKIGAFVDSVIFLSFQSCRMFQTIEDGPASFEKCFHEKTTNFKGYIQQSEA